ncbi:NADH-quinone oxidoreductase subunit NuoE family protein [Parapedobacter tibetensis]|uniref:NADH-quinone oxidoreductase subunit NuoE family protein n=1 Tax=Parapedobacter tibetensis TaxID=2972951 RepID=UPI00214D179A|nr:NAD(P)H-dependent oxidoreductase subunit E [Parapedobacter tibetensis]
MLNVKHNEPVEFTEEMLGKFAEIVARYPEGRQKSALLPILHEVQAKQGWLSVPAMDKVAEYLQLEPIEVYEVASFYTMFFRQPRGKYVLEICRTGPCCLVGAERIMKHIESKLDVREGEVTPDGQFSWRGVECLAACGYGPVLQIGPEYTFYENLTEEKIDKLINELRNKAEGRALTAES